MSQVVFTYHFIHLHFFVVIQAQIHMCEWGVGWEDRRQAMIPYLIFILYCLMKHLSLTVLLGKTSSELIQIYLF